MVTELARLVRNWSGTCVSGLRKDGKLDKRKFNKRVLREGWVLGIVDEHGDFVSGTTYPSLWSDSLLWELLGDAIKRNTGISLSHDRAWRDLGLWESGSRWHTPQMLQEMEAVLIKLDLAGYIYFNSAGSIWCISLKSDLRE